MLYGELFPEGAGAKAAPMHNVNGVLYRQLVQQGHEPVSGTGITYVEIKHDIVHGERETVCRVNGLMVTEQLSSPPCTKEL